MSQHDQDPPDDFDLFAYSEADMGPSGSSVEPQPLMWDDEFVNIPAPSPAGGSVNVPPTSPPSAFGDTPEPNEEASVRARVQKTMRDCIAAMQHRPGGELIEVLNYMSSSATALKYLTVTQRQTFRRLAEVLISCWADDKLRAVDLFDVPDLDAASSRVISEAEAVQARVGAADLPTTPTSSWRALVNHVQRIASKDGAVELIDGIRQDLPDVDLMKMFRSLQPPTASTSERNTTFSRTAAQWEADNRKAAAEAPPIRISSGYPTLDWAFTAKDGRGDCAEPFGAFAPGEFHVIAAPTGNGKSALSRRLITAMAEDLVSGWRRQHDKVLIAITEENPAIVYQAASIESGQAFHHLAGNIVISDVGASRARLVHSVWDLVIQAFHRSRETGIPIYMAGLPTVIVWDYIGGTGTEQPADTVAMEINANLAMRGFAQWDIEAMEAFSGESFAAYAGMPWPVGMGNFQPTVIAFAQFKKLADPISYDPGNRSCHEADFVEYKADGSVGWELRSGDFRLPTQAEVRGSGVLLNHATSLIILHRSKPQGNPKIFDPVTGRSRLADDRARFLFKKTRNGTDLPFVPMRFDSQPAGPRGQFFDLNAELAIDAGALVPPESYRLPGDPITPPRPTRTPFDGVSY